MHTKAKDILTGRKIDPTFYPVVYGLELEDDWHDEQNWYINVTEGNVIHYDYIEKMIIDLGKKFNIKEIGVDRWNATQMIQNLESEGFTMVPIGQGMKDMSPPTKAKSTEKIDGIVAAIMALDRCVRNQNAAKSSVYDNRSLVII